MVRVDIKPQLLQWARERAGLTTDVLETRFPKLSDWESGELMPTLKQVEAYAKATHAPVGYFFLSEPPAEQLPIPDFRTVGGQGINRPSPDLLDTVRTCLLRQGWYRDFAVDNQEDPLSFVGAASVDSPVVETAGAIRTAIGFNLQERRQCATWTEALRMFIAQVDAAGVLVMCSGVVMNNNRRKLNPDEFRGFALSDDLAPLIFINGADSKAAQMFTLAHELAHIWLGRSALSNATVVPRWHNAVESWCNKVAAELLVPLDAVRAEISNEPLNDLMQRLARRFKVSTLVILRRLLDAGQLNQQEFYQAYNDELVRFASLPKANGGGDFYLTTAARVSKRLARAIVSSTLEGKTLYRDAFRLLGVSKPETFNELGRTLHFDIR